MVSDTAIHHRAYSEPFRLRVGYNGRSNSTVTVTTTHLPNCFFRRGSIPTTTTPRSSCSQFMATATLPFPVSMTSVTSGTSFSWRSKDNLQELVLSFHSISPRDGSPVPGSVASISVHRIIFSFWRNYLQLPHIPFLALCNDEPCSPRLCVWPRHQLFTSNLFL